MSPLVCNVTTPSWQWQFRVCVALQWAVGGAFPIKINFLCSLGMVGWKVSLWSSARQAYFISPGRKQQSPKFPCLLGGSGANVTISESKPRVSFLTEIFFQGEFSLDENEWNSHTTGLPKVGSGDSSSEITNIAEAGSGETKPWRERRWGESELAERAMRQEHRSWGDMKAEGSRVPGQSLGEERRKDRWTRSATMWVSWPTQLLHCVNTEA